MELIIFIHICIVHLLALSVVNSHNYQFGAFFYESSSIVFGRRFGFADLTNKQKKKLFIFEFVFVTISHLRDSNTWFSVRLNFGHFFLQLISIDHYDSRLLTISNSVPNIIIIMRFQQYPIHLLHSERQVDLLELFALQRWKPFVFFSNPLCISLQFNGVCGLI